MFPPSPALVGRCDAPSAGRGGRRHLAVLLAAFVLLTLAACRRPQQMASQPSYKPYKGTTFFADGSSARLPVAGTVARGMLREDSFLLSGKVDNQPVNSFPFEITAETLQRGRERYDIHCSMCHARTGNGDGMIVRRGYTRPPSFHSPELRARAAGYYFDVITNGFGVMPPYRAQVPVEDRWAIVAYIRVLQMSQDATMADVPAERRGEVR